MEYAELQIYDWMEIYYYYKSCVSNFEFWMRIGFGGWIELNLVRISMLKSAKSEIYDVVLKLKLLKSISQ